MSMLPKNKNKELRNFRVSPLATDYWSLITHSGFTLLEVLIAMAIMSTIIVAVGYFGLDVSTFGILLGDSFKVQQEIGQTFQIMGSEIRSMGPAENGSYMIAAASSQSFSFYSDSAGDGTFELIRYFFQNGVLKRGVIQPTGSPEVYNPVNEVVSDRVHDVVTAASPSYSRFWYYDQNFNGSSPALSDPINLPNIRIVRLQVIADPTPLDVHSRTTQSVTVKVRNLPNSN